jgi:hypothetical protein
MIGFNHILILLLAHWIGDYLLQFNSIANHKADSFYWLGIHVLIYSGVLFVASLFLFSLFAAIKYFLVNGLLHLVTDWITGNLASRYKSNQRVFYIIIGFDQFVHTITLLGTAVYVLT